MTSPTIGELRKVLGLPVFSKKLIAEKQTAKQIMKELLTVDKLYQKDYQKIASYFKRGTTRATAENIFYFLKENIKKNTEPYSRQTSKTPAVLFYTREADCKNYSNFAAGILRALGYPVAYRFVSFDIMDPTPTHVYVVTYDSNGKEIIVDAVLKNFNEEKPYFYKQDIDPMALYRISGVEQNKLYRISGVTQNGTYLWRDSRGNVYEGDGIGNLFKNIVKGAGNVVKHVANTGANIIKTPVNVVKSVASGNIAQAGQAVINPIKNVINLPAGMLKAADPALDKAISAIQATTIKVAASIPRNAFLALVSMNFLNLKTQLKQAILSNPTKVAVFWSKFGGDFNALKGTIGCVVDRDTMAYIGVDPATLMASAAPVVAAAIALLKEMNVGVDPRLTDAVASIAAVKAPDGTEMNTLQNVLDAGGSVADTLKAGIKSGVLSPPKLLLPGAGDLVKTASGLIDTTKSPVLIKTAATSSNLPDTIKVKSLPTTVSKAAASRPTAQVVYDIPAEKNSGMNWLLVAGIGAGVLYFATRK